MIFFIFLKNLLKFSIKTAETKSTKEVYMKKIKNTLKQLWQDESGQGATEYILILVVVAVIVMVFRDNIKTIIGRETNAVGSKLGGAIGNLGDGF